MTDQDDQQDPRPPISAIAPGWRSRPQKWAVGSDGERQALSQVGDLAGAPVPYAGAQSGSANVARVYDHWLGGRDNYREDRDAAALIEQLTPQARLGARANRALLARIVDHLVREGIDQLLDLGSGLPTAGNVHQIAQAINPHAHTVYVDHDPVVAAHARALLWRQPHTQFLQADIREVDEIFEHPDLTETLDLTKPVALLFSAVLHFIPDEQNPTALVAAYASRLAPGSVVVITHGTTPQHLVTAVQTAWPEADPFVPPSAPEVTTDPRAIAEAIRLYRDLVGDLTLRSFDAVARLVGPLPLDAPGVVPAEAWNPAGAPPATMPAAPILVAVGRVP